MEDKYRAWDVQHKFYGKVHFLSWMSDGIEVDYMGNNNEPRKVGPDEVILEKYIGNEDDFGTEMYEGDICEITYLDGDKEKFLIIWDEETRGFSFLDSCGMSWITTATPIKVIGNIHENPELMET